MPRLVWPIEYDGQMIQNVPSKNAPRLVAAQVATLKRHALGAQGQALQREQYSSFHRIRSPRIQCLDRTAFQVMQRPPSESVSRRHLNQSTSRRSVEIGLYSCLAVRRTLRELVDQTGRGRRSRSPAFVTRFRKSRASSGFSNLGLPTCGVRCASKLGTTTYTIALSGRRTDSGRRTLPSLTTPS